jgi:hypothetical protein
VLAPGQPRAESVELVTVGSSHAWGHGIEAEQTYTYLIAKALGMTARNLAMPSYGTVHSLQMLERNRDLSPKLILHSIVTDHMRRNVTRCASIYYAFCIDQSFVDGNLTIRRPLTNGVRRAQVHARYDSEGLGPAEWLFHGLDVELGRVLLRPEDVDEATRERVLAFLLQRMNETARAAGARLLLIYIPYSDGLGPSGALRRATAGVDLIDMTDVLRRRGPSSWIVDDGHISADSHGMIAEAVADFWRATTR